MKKIISLSIMVLVIMSLTVGCASEGGNGGDFDSTKIINVVSREEG